MDDVTLLVTRRRALLNGSRWDAGRLLRYSPDESQECGGALIYSAGFFTWNNVPPWDTWVALEGASLLSWVPEAYVPVVELGIDANPERCLTWAD